jgi:hypothetical protein
MFAATETINTQHRGGFMNFKKCCLTALLVMGFSPLASARGLGISGGAGLPFLSQFGLHYFFNNKFAVYAGYNNLSLSIDSAKTTLTMPELTLQYHPFDGAFFIGLGAGSETLKATATDSTTGLEAAIEVTATTGIGKLGWMWGAGDGGLWFGIDVAFISPSGAKETITAPGVSTTAQAYLDAQEAAKKFGSTAYTSLTFFRLGYLF